MKKTTCSKCGKKKELPTKRYCRNCSNAYMREWRKDSEKTMEARAKASIRSKTKMRIRRGLLIKKPCEICGEKKVEAHHDDYNKEYSVRWLCFKHHREHHKKERMMKMRNPKASEHQECRAYFEWASHHPLLSEYLVHHANEGKRTALAGFYLKQIGLSPGFPDYQFMLSNEKYHGLFIEMKTKEKKNHKMPENQVGWIDRLLKAGHYATFCFGADHAIQVTTDYLNNKL